MFLPLRRYSSTSGANPVPPHTSHTVSTVELKPRSVMITPSPLHSGHAPSELALKSAGLTPLAFANAERMTSSSPVYVAGLLRREPRIGDWSTTTTSSNAGTLPWMSDDLPDPATPVTTVRMPSGMSTSTSQRLCCVAPRIARAPFGERVDGLS